MLYMILGQKNERKVMVLFILSNGHALFGDGVFLHVTSHNVAHGAILLFFFLVPSIVVPS